MEHKNIGYELKIHSQDDLQGIVEHSLDLQGLCSYDIVNNLIHYLTKNSENVKNTVLTIINCSNGISIVRDYQCLNILKDKTFLIEEIKVIANIILGYEEAEETFLHD
ncbi:DUF1869 domain-containing protein (plasmid) [Klebsiella aerogenes]|uniref:DUF1869 domain-containing protein n=1 Tax=Klebsiella aerogenes TaxID=548 RepID=UPI00124E3B59|nr:DUF1869 domain-containing protein [Klebsiella aerogenes]QFI19814.1 DUF1869 domain-containing protein [Klebsiella aerogenes]